MQSFAILLLSVIFVALITNSVPSIATDDSDDNNDSVLVESEDFESWYDGEVVGIEFLADGVTKVINKEDFRDFCKFISQTHDEFIRAEDEED